MKEKAQLSEPKYSARYWGSEIRRAEDKHGKFWDSATESIKVFNCEGKVSDEERRLSVWWYIVTTLLPAYFARVPKVEAQLRKRSGSMLYQITATAIERATDYELEECIDFPDVAYSAALSFLLTGRAVLWNRYEANITKSNESYGLIKTESGLVDAEGKPYAGEVEPVQDEQGMYSVTEEVEKKEGERAIMECLHFKDFLTQPARNKHEVEWKARRAYVSRDEATEKFGKDTANKFSYNVAPEDVDDKRSKSEKFYEQKAELFEIYCEEKGKVYWTQNGNEKDFLETSDPPVKFKDFYPCCEISASVDPSSVIPVSDYVHCKDQILEVERLTSRIHGVTQAIRANGMYDAVLGEEVESLLKGDLKLRPSKNWPSYKARGGLANSIEFLNVEPYIRALEVLLDARNIALERLYETTKCGDLLRGISDPRKTATANELESGWSTLGLSVRQKQFEKFISDAISKYAEIICEHFDPEHIAQVVDAEKLLEAQQEVTWEQVVQVMKDDPARRYRIQIASDSMMALDERKDRQERVDMMASTGSFLGQMVPFIEKYPAAAPYALKINQYVIRSYKAGKELEPELQGFMQAIAMQAQQQAQQMQNQPAPGTMEAQAKMQAAQIQAQTDQMRMSMERETQQMKSLEKAKELAVEVQRLMLEKEKLQVEIAKMRGDQEIKILEINRDTQKFNAQLVKEAMDTKQERIKAQQQ